VSPLSWTLICVLSLLAPATCAWAQNSPLEPAVANAAAPDLDQAIYKGVVGNFLDAVPMDPAKRVELQRFNAVAGNTASGRSLAVLAGFSNPVLMAVGFIWGLFAASNIKPVAAATKSAADPKSPGDAPAPVELAATAPPHSSAEPHMETVREPALLTARLAGNPDGAVAPSPPVIKIWLPQSSLATQ
jgi:hypothetical protein